MPLSATSAPGNRPSILLVALLEVNRFDIAVAHYGNAVFNTFELRLQITECLELLEGLGIIDQRRCGLNSRSPGSGLYHSH
jgi:hypothetical protein